MMNFLLYVFKTNSSMARTVSAVIFIGHTYGKFHPCSNRKFNRSGDLIIGLTVEKIGVIMNINQRIYLV